MNERDAPARGRAYQTAIRRVSRINMAIVGALFADLDKDEMGREVAIGQLIEAERNCDAVLMLVRDCRRSLGDESEADPEGKQLDRLLNIIARMESAIEITLTAEVEGADHEALQPYFHRLDEARLLPPDILATVRRRQEEMDAE